MSSLKNHKHASLSLVNGNMLISLQKIWVVKWHLHLFIFIIHCNPIELSKFCSFVFYPNLETRKEKRYREPHCVHLMNGIRLRPQVLIDVSHIDMSTSILGYKISMPIMVAPTALHKLAHQEGFRVPFCYFFFSFSDIKKKVLLWRFIWNAGEVASAQAASAAGTIMVCKIAPFYRLSDDSHINSFTGYIFRYCLHGHLAALRKLTQVHQDSVSSNFQYEVHAHHYIITFFPVWFDLSPVYCHCHM